MLSRTVVPAMSGRAMSVPKLPGYSTVNMAPTTEGDEVVGRFVFHDGRWWYAGPVPSGVEGAALLRELDDVIMENSVHGPTLKSGWLVDRKALFDWIAARQAKR